MQITLEGKKKELVAIERLQEYEPPEGYYLAFSGGKDSVCIYNLAIKAKVKFKAYYNITGIDPPELLHFMRDNYKDITWLRPEFTMWELIEKRGIFPMRQRRFCCQYLKEYNPFLDMKYTVILGTRREESFGRSNRAVHELMKDKKRMSLMPIIDWSLLDVWQFIDDNHLPYCKLYDEGFERIGCLLCPMEGNGMTKFIISRYPSIINPWLNSARKLESIGKMPKGMKAEEYLDWWLSRKSIKEYRGQKQEGKGLIL